MKEILKEENLKIPLKIEVKIEWNQEIPKRTPKQNETKQNKNKQETNKQAGEGNCSRMEKAQAGRPIRIPLIEELEQTSCRL